MCTKFYGECKAYIEFPITKSKQWKKLVFERQWGKSARELAKAWLKNINDLPSGVQCVFSKSGIFNFVKLEKAIVEKPVKLDGLSSRSHPDIMVYTMTGNGGLVLSVEGKKDERFDKTIDKWRKGGQRCKGKSGKPERLTEICKILEIKLTDDDERKIRYQLLHRAVCAIKEAKEKDYGQAMLLIHSFSKKNIYSDSNFNDFQSFGKIMEIKEKIKPNTLYFSKKIDNINFYMLWFNSNCSEK